MFFLKSAILRFVDCHICVLSALCVNTSQYVEKEKEINWFDFLGIFKYIISKNGYASYTHCVETDFNWFESSLNAKWAFYRRLYVEEIWTWCRPEWIETHLWPLMLHLVAGYRLCVGSEAFSVVWVVPLNCILEHFLNITTVSVLMTTRQQIIHWTVVFTCTIIYFNVMSHFRKRGCTKPLKSAEFKPQSEYHRYSVLLQYRYIRVFSVGDYMETTFGALNN